MGKFGCNKVNKDFRDYKLKSVRAMDFPSSYRIDKNLKIKDQGWVNSCVAHSLSSFEECVYNKEFSTDFIYGYRPATYFQGEGMNMRDALHTLITRGDCLNDMLPGNTEVPKVYDKVKANSTTYILQAFPYKVKSYARIFTKNQIKEVLLRDIPVPVSIPVRSDLQVIGDMIEYNKEEPITGYHAILIIGYTPLGYIVQNSWGNDWGENGTAILPYEYPLDSAWAINVDDEVAIKEPLRWLAVIGNFIYNLFKRN